MAYAVPQSKKSIKQNRFEFTIEDEAFDVPLLRFLPISVAERVAVAEATGDDNEALKAQLEIFGPADTPLGRAVRGLDAEQFLDLLTALSEASSIAPGESPASTDS